MTQKTSFLVAWAIAMGTFLVCISLPVQGLAKVSSKSLPSKSKAEVYSATENTLPPSASLPMSKTPAFDPVPNDQVDPLLKRLKLVEALIQQHGRAYDYRMLTVKELEMQLAALNGPKAPKSIPVKPVIAQPIVPAIEAPAPAPAPEESEELPPPIAPSPEELDDEEQSI